MYLLDTDTFSEFLREELSRVESAPITNRISLTEPGTILISIVTVSEMMKGMLNLLQRLEKMGRDEAGFGELLRVYFAWQRFPIQPYDTCPHNIHWFLACRAPHRPPGLPDSRDCSCGKLYRSDT